MDALSSCGLNAKPPGGFAYNPEIRSELIGGTSEGKEGGFAAEASVIFPG
jgi:hypothetical protein